MSAHPAGSKHRRQDSDHGSVHTPTRSGRSLYTVVCIACATVLGAVLATAPLGFGASDYKGHRPAQRCLGLVAVVVVLWSTEAIAPYLTALLIPLMAIPLRVLCVPRHLREETESDTLLVPASYCNSTHPAPGTPMDAEQAVVVATGSFFDPVILLFLSGFVMSEVLLKRGISERCAAAVLVRAGTGPRRILAAVMVACMSLSSVTSNVPASVLGTSLLKPTYRPGQCRTTWPVISLLGIAFAGNVGGMTSPIASPQNVVAIIALERATFGKVSLSFSDWLAVSVPFTIVSTFLVFAFLLVMYGRGLPAAVTGPWTGRTTTSRTTSHYGRKGRGALHRRRHSRESVDEMEMVLIGGDGDERTVDEDDDDKDDEEEWHAYGGNGVKDTAVTQSAASLRHGTEGMKATLRVDPADAQHRLDSGHVTEEGSSSSSVAADHQPEKSRPPHAIATRPSTRESNPHASMAVAVGAQSLATSPTSPSPVVLTSSLSPLDNSNTGTGAGTDNAPSLQRRGITMEDVFIVTVILGTMGLWVCFRYVKPYFGSVGIVALLPIIVFGACGYLPVVDFNRLSWDVLILMGGGLSLGTIVDSSGLLLVVGDAMGSMLEGQSLFIVLLSFSSLVAVLANFISSTVAAVLLLPVVAEVGVSVGHPRMLVMLCAFMTSGAMGLPVSSFPNANSFAQRDGAGAPILTNTHYVKSGFPVCVMILFLINTLGFGLCLALHY
eukprot:m.205617 g.205617  ORF g.205617 m.205617 type:complete len:722 (-) comp23026_c0_seq1:101-2266(-)